MTDVPSNLIPTRISQLPEYTGSSQEGYLPYVYEGVTYKVRFSGVASAGEVPPSRTLTAGTGLTGGGDLSADRVFAISDGGVGADQLDATGVVAGVYGDASNVPTITVDANGRVSDVTTSPIVALGYVPESRVITAGDGLSGGGNLADDRSFSVNFSSVAPSPLGSASAGVANVAAREDHVHPAVDLSDMTETQGTLPLGRGGTGASLSPIAGAVAYSNGTHMSLTPVGVVGQVLVSGGVNAPSWVTLTGTGTVTSVNIDGATSGLNFIGGPITTAGVFTLQDPGFIQFDTAYGASRNTGRLWWNDDDNAKTLMVGGEGSDVDIKVGEQNYFRIKASAAITKGQVVMFTGTVGASGGLQAAPATGLTKATASYIMGIAAEDIALNGWGYITEFGLIRQLDTTAFSDGDILYYDPDVVGGLRVGAPPAPAAKAELAAVVYSASNGSIFVRATHQFELEQLNDVETAAASDLDLLEYNGSSGVWRHRDPQVINVGGATNVLNGAANQLVYQTGSGSSSFVAAPTSANTFLEWSGSAFQWSANPLGTVTSVDVSGGTTGLTASGGPITSSGTITLGGTLAVANGGTGATDAATALTNLGAYPASNPDGYTNNTGTVTSVAATAGTGISVSGSPITASGTLTITNTAPDQTVTLTQGGTTTITGTYPNFTISSADQYDGTVTSVAATVPTGFTVGGSPITTSGTLAIGFDTGYSLPTDAEQANWDTAYTDRYKWDGGSSGLVAATGRTSLGLGTSAVLDAGVAGGVATLDGGGTVPTSQLPSAVIGAVSYQGTWNASTNTPTLTSSTGTQGYYYVVSVAGTTTLDGISDWGVGDWAIFNGSTWDKIDNTDAVTSVNGYTGTVVLDYSDVGAYADTNPAGYTTNTGTVTSVGGTGTVNGLTLSGTVTSSGNLTLGGTLAISNADWSGTDLSVANGGTGVSSLTSGYLLKGNGTSPVSASVIYDNGTNVGIGTSSPSAKLDISAGTNLNIGFRQLSLANYANEGIGFTLSRTTSDADLMAIGVADSHRLGMFSREGMVFATGGGISYSETSEAMRITSAGSVGIGTSSPSQTLQVQGTGYATSDFRAPRFYDSNNTAYYVDPASTSVFNKLTTSRASSDQLKLERTNSDNNVNIEFVGTSTTRYLGKVGGDLKWGGSADLNNTGDTIFHDGYHPNADTLTTARTISLTGDVSGSTSFNGSANVSITATVADDSHNHIISNVDGLQTALDSRVDYYQTAVDTTAGYVSGFESDTRLGLISSSTNSTGSTGFPTGYGATWSFRAVGGANSSNWHRHFDLHRANGDNAHLYVRGRRGSDGLPLSWQQLFSDEYAPFNNLTSKTSGTGTYQTSGSFRAPIFYDSNNTARYLDPTSTSLLTTVEAYDGSGFRSFATPSASVVSQIYFGNAGNTRAWNWQLDENNDAALWNYNGSAWSKRVTVTTGSEIFLRNSFGNDLSLAYPSVFGYSSAYRTTVIGNQAYNTVCIGVSPASNASGSFNGNGEGREVMFRNGVNFITPNSANNSYLNPLNMTDGYVSSSGSFRAPIFYDSDNTGYNLNANGNAWQLQTPTGYLRAGPMNTGYCHFNTDRARYYFDKEVQFDGGINDYSGNWTFTDSLGQHNASLRAPIFYDSNNTAYYVDPNGTSSMADAIIGARTMSTAMFYAGFTLDANTMPANSTGFTYSVNAPYTGPVARFSTGGAYDLWLNAPYGAGTGLSFRTRNGDNGTINPWRDLAVYGSTAGAADLYATIYYDSQNTGYYVDPQNTSVLWEAGTYYLRNLVDVSGDHPYGLYFSSNRSGAYAIFRESGAWTHPYPDLRIAFHTGIKLGANAGYQGIRFYTDYDMVTQVMSVNNGSDGLGASNVYVNNSLQAGSSLRAPVFYDSNNTGYYADLNSTGDSIRAAGDIVAYYSDDRLKDRGDNIANALDKVQSLNGFHYTANETAQKFGYKANPQVGVSAQEVEAVLPEVVKDAAIGHGYKTVDYAKLVPLLIEAIKELKAEVETLKKG